MTIGIGWFVIFMGVSLGVGIRVGYLIWGNDDGDSCHGCSCEK